MKYCNRALAALIIFFTANIPAFLKIGMPSGLIPVLALLFVAVNLIPSIDNGKIPGKRLRICGDGCELLILFLLSTAASIACQLFIMFRFFPQDKKLWLWNFICLFLVEAVVFWNGIIRVYCTSFQLGMRWRVIGILCGWIPVAHLVALWKIIDIVSFEVRLESEKILKNRQRKSQEICRTKYPVLMVHGVFFRDFKYFNYWGRIPAELEANGARIYYGNHQSAASVADSGKELAGRILQILKETGSEKVNVIAHSKGGLDTRYAISHLRMDRYVASLTTINTPHRGCLFADYLLDKIPDAVEKKVADGYNMALKKIGDENPDFMAAVTDLTASACEKFNRETPDMPGVYYQSVGSRLNVATDGRFPLNFSHDLVKYFDGPNDGLVAETSFPWGVKHQFLTTKGRRGISHGDMVDLNRENIRDFDVREFYVGLVSELKNMGF